MNAVVSSAAVQAGGESAGTYRIVRPDGEVRHVSCRRIATATPDGKPRTLFGSIQDVTERRRAEEARRDAPELFEKAFSHAPIGMTLVALDGRWLKVNRAMCEIVGWPEEALLGLTFRDITHPDDLPGQVERLRQLVAGEISSFQTDKRYIGRDGREIWANLSVSLVRDRAGNPCHYIGQVQDISDRKRYELALREERLALYEAQRLAQIGSWSWNIRAGTAYWSAEMCRCSNAIRSRAPPASRACSRKFTPRTGSRPRRIRQGLPGRERGARLPDRARGRLDAHAARDRQRGERRPGTMSARSRT